MTQIVADTNLGERLKSLAEPARVVDEAGRTLGVFRPAGLAPAGWARANSPFSREELERRRDEARKHPEQGKSLTAVLTLLKQLTGEQP